MLKLNCFMGVKSLLTLILLAGVAINAVAQHSADETKKDIARHRAMAAAHEAAAKCFEAGKKEEQCLKELQAACKGLAIGKYCGMKHEH
jgi:ADP-heptose:LPS heptosyltransferase